jgi:hypothetical protein
MGAERTTISISDEEKLWLESYSKARGISTAEAIREEPLGYQSLVAQTKGVWKKGDGLDYQRNLRSEWR